MQIRSNQDLYAVVARLKEEASSRGDENTAKAISDAFARGGVTASEQLGEIRIALRHIRSHVQTAYGPEVLVALDAVLRAIDKVLPEKGD